MIICFNCSSETKKILDKLLETGQYADYTELISVAIANQSILQTQVTTEGALIINLDDETRPSIQESLEVERVVKGHSNETTTTHKKRSSIKGQEFPNEKSVPSIFFLDGTNGKPSAITGLPSDYWIAGQDVPLDRWLFGQYNKLLPAKANCRALAQCLRNEPKGILLEEATARIIEEAARLGDFLKYQDEINGLGRDEALSTAFPSASEGEEKGRLRYANQFIANVNKQGQVSGLLMDLKLINSKGGKKPRLLFTEVGWQFALLKNPVLDSLHKSLIQKFSDEEVELLLSHIARNVPVEDFAYRSILTAILDGANSPDTIDSALQKYVPADPTRNLSSSFLSSQRSGAISRMADLRLVERVRDGVRVSYVVTESGKKYLEKR